MESHRFLFPCFIFSMMISLHYHPFFVSSPLLQFLGLPSPDLYFTLSVELLPRSSAYNLTILWVCPQQSCCVVALLSNIFIIPPTFSESYDYRGSLCLTMECSQTSGRHW